MKKFKEYINEEIVKTTDLENKIKSSMNDSKILVISAPAGSGAEAMATQTIKKIDSNYEHFNIGTNTKMGQNVIDDIHDRFEQLYQSSKNIPKEKMTKLKQQYQTRQRIEGGTPKGIVFISSLNYLSAGDINDLAIIRQAYGSSRKFIVMTKSTSSSRNKDIDTISSN